MIYGLFFLISTLLGVYYSSGYILLVFFWLFSLFFSQNKPKLWRLFLLSFLGFLWAWFYGYQQLKNQVDESFLNQKITLVGTIEDITKQQPNKTQFIFVSEQPFKAKLKLNWYSYSNNIPKLSVGQQWQILVKLKRNNGFANPDGFDYETWLFSKGFSATGYVISKGANHKLAQTNQYLVNQTRAHIKQQLLPKLQSLENAGVIYALISGNRALISAQKFSQFIDTNTSHLTVVSGLHIGLISGFMFLLSLWGYRRCHRCCLKMPAVIFASMVGLITALTYALLAGFSIATERAFIMASVVFLSIIFRRHFNHWHLYTLALILVLIRHPLSVLELGFWLSFGAVGVILYGVNLYMHQAKIWQFFSVQVLISLAMMPLLFLLFSGASLVSIPANLIAVPLVSFIILPLSLLASVFWLIGVDLIANPLFYLADITLSYLSAYLIYLGQIPLSYWHWKINGLAFILLLLAMIILFLPKGLKLRWLGVVILIILLSNPTKPTLKHGEIKLTTFDIGQGLAVLAQTQHQNLLFDTGFANASFSVAQSVIVPFLNANHIKHLDTLIVSHGDNDHSGGVAILQPFLSQANILSSGTKNIPATLTIKHCQSGQFWQSDGVKFTILSPTDTPYKKDNNNSCVLRIDNGKYSILLTGDIEKKAEKQLIKIYGKQLKSTVLIVPHHGSKTSSSQAFLQAVSPSIAINSSGFNNRFRHPHPDIKQRYDNNNITFYDTQCSGQINLKLSSTITIKQHRLNDSRYWIRQCKK